MIIIIYFCYYYYCYCIIKGECVWKVWLCTVLNLIKESYAWHYTLETLHWKIIILKIKFVHVWYNTCLLSSRVFSLKYSLPYANLKKFEVCCESKQLQCTVPNVWGLRCHFRMTILKCRLCKWKKPKRRWHACTLCMNSQIISAYFSLTTIIWSSLSCNSNLQYNGGGEGCVQGRNYGREEVVNNRKREEEEEEEDQIKVEHLKKEEEEGEEELRAGNVGKREGKVELHLSGFQPFHYI